jgi:predicted phage-related endonuclease
MKVHTNLTEEQWLNLRKRNVNSTDTAALFNLSSYKTEFQLYHLMKGNIEDDFKENQRTIIGQEVESGIAAAFKRISGWDNEPLKDYLEIPEKRIGSSFDYKVKSGPFKDYNLEIKNVDYLVFRDQWTYDSEGDGEAPPHIEVQVQHQCMVSGAPGAIILACVGGNDLKWIIRERDNDMIMGIDQRIKKFWHDVDNSIEPSPNYQGDVAALKQLYGSSSNPDEVYDAGADEEITALLSNYQDWGNEIKRLEAMRESVKAEVWSQIGEASKVIAHGYSISCGMTKGSSPETMMVTEDMVGKEIELSKGRKGYRQFRVTKRKEK